VVASVNDVEHAYLAGFFDGEGCICINYQPSLRQCSLRLQVTQQWVWSCQSLQAAAALRAMLPFLDVKRDQAEIALEFQATMLPQGTRGAKEQLRPVREALKLRLQTAKREE